VALTWPLQRRGSTGEPVRSVQYLLRAHNHAVDVDGIYGPQTESAVHAFQAAAGLAADGIVGNQTWPRLVITVRQGSTGDAVRGVQSQAQFRNLSGDPSKGLAIDGIFGPKTEEFVRSFQQGVGIAVDGIVGPVTWNHLVKEELSF
jgi:peptidoglycan hydrolase-like protein with peptidoglycan-binding domain